MAKIIVVPHYEGTDELNVLMSKILFNELKKKQEKSS